MGEKGKAGKVERRWEGGRWKAGRLVLYIIVVAAGHPTARRNQLEHEKSRALPRLKRKSPT